MLHSAIRSLKQDGTIISLIKPHYEALPEELDQGTVKDDSIQKVISRVTNDIEVLGGKVLKSIESPITGKRGQNKEFLFLIKPK